MTSTTHKQSSLGDLLLVFRRNVVDALRKEGLRHDLTFSQSEVLNFIGPVGKETMKSIANYLKITPPSATAIIADMEKKGLVERKSDKNDRRIVYIILTDMAKKLCVSLSKRKEVIVKKMISKLSQKDRVSFERIIRILITE